MRLISPQVLGALTLGVLIIAAPQRSLASASAGGACPSAANYISLSSPASGGGQGSVTLASLGVTTCFFVAANGSDTNNGTSESTPWLHAPGMPSCSSNCSSVAISSGTGIIFRGADTWHKGSGSPSTGGAFSWSTSGSSLTSPIYFGIDLGWFSGSSFARPVFSEDNPPSTGRPSSCSYDDDGTTFFSLNSTKNVIVDGLELTGDCAANSGSGEVIQPGNQNVLERIYIHGWTFAASSSGDTRYRIGGNGTDQGRYLFMVIDGEDSTFGTTCTNTSCVQNGGNFVSNGAAGWSFEDCWDVEYSVVRHVSNMECQQISINHDNLFEYNFEPSIGGQHGNVLETLSPGSACNNFFYYNNIYRNVNQGVGLWPQCNNFYFFNNVFENDGHYPPDPNGIMASPPGSSGSGLVTLYYSNNTSDSSVQGRAGPSNQYTPAWASGSTATFANNHIIGFTAPISNFFTCGSGDSCDYADNGGEVYQTVSTASSQGYTLANNFAPTSTTSGTVGKGTNNSSACGNIPNSDASTACMRTIGSVSEVAGWGGQLAQYPAIPVNARPSSGAWDSGAYEFAAGNSVNPPTGLSAVVQ